MKIPVNANMLRDMENSEWEQHWGAHEQDACLPQCLVCEAMAEPALKEAHCVACNEKKVSICPRCG